MLGNTEDEGDLGIIGQDSELLTSDLTWLKSVSEAVERIDNGNYGECVSCGQDIDEETLAALPWVAFCLRCAIQRHKELEEPLRQAEEWARKEYRKVRERNGDWDAGNAGNVRS